MTVLPRSARNLMGAWLLAGFCASIHAQVIRPLPIPGRIQAEDYDTHGSGVSYMDDTAGNSGGVYRQDDVDIEVTQDQGGGFNIGWIGAGEWLNYTTVVQETAVYRFAFRVAALNGPAMINVSLDGLPFCSLTVPTTGAWQNWQTVTVSNLVLVAGEHLLRLDFKTGGHNLNYLQVAKQKDLEGGFLRVSGKRIIDGNGQNIVLRGMGLGNWMLQEPYMMDVSGIVDNQQQLKAKIAELAGSNNMALFYESWLTNAFTAADADALASFGFNSVRLPMHYALFTLPADQEPTPGQHTWLESGFKLVDDLLAWCASNRLYLILDMHGCPGGQGYDKPISDYNPPAPSLWQSPANRAKLIAVWTRLANRYALESWIGGYDLINEPNWTFENHSNLNGCNDQTNAPLRQLLIDITAAIRQVDTNHMIFLAGNCWGGNYNGILPPWDSNLVISLHKYWDSTAPESFQRWIDMRDQWNMPIWLGESGENSNEWFRDAVQNCESFNIGWAWWPWKKIGTISGTVTIAKPPGYQRILDYWRNTASRPSTNEAMAGLLALAQAARFENSMVHRDVLDALLRPNTGGLTVPFTNHTVPGRIFSAHYDLGRPGEAYTDTTTNSPHNSGNAFRNDSVDIEACSDSAPNIGFNLGWLEAGEWTKYTVTPLASGPYSVSARVASSGGGGSFYIEAGGSNVTGTIAIPDTGGWQNWQTITLPSITNMSLLSSFKVVVVSPGFNLHWLNFQATPGSRSALTPASEGDAFRLSWPATASGFMLQSTSNLAPSAIWSAVTNPVQAEGTKVFVRVPRSNSRAFFRLAAP